MNFWKILVNETTAKLIILSFLEEKAAKQANPVKAKVYRAISAAVSAVEFANFNKQTVKNMAAAFRAAANILDANAEEL